MGGDLGGEAVVVRGAFAKPPFDTPRTSQQVAGRGFPCVGECGAGRVFGSGDSNFAAHQPGDVFFVVEVVGDHRDCAAGDNLSGEDAAATKLARDHSADVVAK